MARLLTGREAASALTEELKGRTASLARQGVTPKLVILRCGETPYISPCSLNDRSGCAIVQSIHRTASRTYFQLSRTHAAEAPPQSQALATLIIVMP